MKMFKKIQFVMMTLLFMMVSCEFDDSQNLQFMDTDFSVSVLKAETLDNPDTQDLWAGQNLDVGEVQVEKDGDNIIVRYVIDHPDWCLTETHLQVATDLAGIPQKNGNPIPGKFEFKEEHDCITEFEYTLNYKERGWECDESLLIAAHAVVKSTVCEQTGVVYGMARNTGDVWGIDVVNGTAWVEFESVAPIPSGISPNGLAYDGVSRRMYYCNYRTSAPRDLYFWDYSTGSEVLAGNLGVENAAADFYKGKYYYIASLPASDDLYEVTLNKDGTMFSNLKIVDLSADAHKWTFSGDIAIKDGILYGWGRCATHGKYEFFTYNLTTGDFTLNETAYQAFSMQLAFGTNGVLYGHESKAPGNFYEIDITNGNLSAPLGIDPGTLYTDCSSGMICEPEEETAWGGEEDFDGKNWAVYFEYTIPCCDEWIVYGSNLNAGTDEFDDAIYSVDLNDQNNGRTLVYDPTPINSDQNYPNANAYDPDNNRIYFGNSDGNLFYHEIGTGTHVQVGSGFGTMACGAWYNGKYYYVQNGSNRLYEVTIVSDVATRTQIGTVPTGNGYGDIAFDPENPGVFIGSAGSTAVWYVYDTNDGGSSTLTRSGGIAKHLQLAYGSNGQLYGVEAVGGQFYEIEYDETTVTLTEYWNSHFPFTDLASGPQCN